MHGSAIIIPSSLSFSSTLIYPHRALVFTLPLLFSALPRQIAGHYAVEEESDIPLFWVL
jgi:hypothetical protein